MNALAHGAIGFAEVRYAASRQGPLRRAVVRQKTDEFYLDCLDPLSVEAGMSAVELVQVGFEFEQSRRAESVKLRREIRSDGDHVFDPAALARLGGDRLI